MAKKQKNDIVIEKQKNDIVIEKTIRKYNLIIRKIKFKVIFVKKVQDCFQYLGKKKFQIYNQSIKFKKAVIPLININDIKPYSKRNKRYYFIDIDNGLIKFNENPSEIDFELVNLFTAKTFFTNILTKIFGFSSSIILLMLIGAIFGVPIGILIGVYFL